MTPPPDNRPEGWEGWLRARMFDQRVVNLVGSLDDERAGRVAAELMTLDASSDEAIRLVVDSKATRRSSAGRATGSSGSSSSGTGSPRPPDDHRRR